MTKNKNTDDLDIVMEGMPGADQKTTEDVEPFQVDLNFGEETPTEDAEAPEEEEVEFPAEEEVVEVEEETADEVEEDEVEEDEVIAEEEIPDAEQEAAEEIVDELVEVEVEEEPEKPVEPQKSPMVPKSRLDEVLAKNKKMQKQLEDIQQKEAEVQAEAPTYDFSSKEMEYQEAILDGDSTKATSIRQEIRVAEKEQTMFEVQQQMGQSIQLSNAEQELAVKAQEIGDTFDVLNEHSESFDTELAGEVRDLRDAFMSQGFTPADSLAKATEYTLAARRPELLQTTDDTAAVQTKKQNKVVVQNRQKAAVKKKLEASKSQPPKLQGEGTAKRGDKVTDLNVLSDEEFSALPEETLRRMRGDFG
jgi:hypothetical protein